MKNKTIVIRKHIHSCFSSFSSNDAWVRIVTKSKDVDFKIEVDSQIVSKKIPGLTGETIKEVYEGDEYVGIYLDADQTFYNRCLSERNYINAEYHKSPEFKELIQSYIKKGFSDDRDEIPVEEKYRAKKRKEENARAKKSGIVLWMDFDKRKTKDYQGGFSDEVFNSKELYDYVKSGGVFGWIGDSGARTAHHDRIIEAGLRLRGISPSQMYNWISSSSGRHFADSLCGYSKKEQDSKIEKSLNYMYNLCLIYGTPSHGGMLSDTNRISGIYKKLGLLLPEDGKYNSKDHINKLLEANKSLSEKENKTPEEEHILEVIKEVFANKL